VLPSTIATPALSVPSGKNEVTNSPKVSAAVSVVTNSSPEIIVIGAVSIFADAALAMEGDESVVIEPDLRRPSTGDMLAEL
jgi:hypothetical protein